MKLTVILVISNILLINCLEYQLIQPGIIEEVYGKLGMIDDYFHVAFRVNLSGLHLQEINNLKIAVEKLCLEIKWKNKDEHGICKNQLANFHQNLELKSEKLLESLVSRDKLSSSYKLVDLNRLKNGEQDQDAEKKISNLVVVDITNDILPNIYEDVANFQRSIETLTEVVSSIENEIEPFDQKIHEYFDTLEHFMESCNGFLLELQNIINQAENHKISPRLLKNIQLSDVLNDKVIANDVNHIIDLNNLSESNVLNIGPSIEPNSIQSLIKAAVLKEDNVPYIIMSLPLSKHKNIDNFELVQLKPIPKLENNVLTFLQVMTDFYISNNEFNRPNYLVKDLSCCYKYNGKFFCDYFLNEDGITTPCVTDVFKYGNRDFCEFYECKLSYLENFGINIIEMHANYSYMIMTEKEVTAVYTGGSFVNMKLEISAGASLIHSKFPVTLKLKELALKIEKDNIEKDFLPYDYNFHFYDLPTPKNEKSSETAQDLLTKNIITVDKLYKLSFDASYIKLEKKKAEQKSKIKPTEEPNTVPPNEPIYIVLIKILATAACLITLLVLFFKYILKYKFILAKDSAKLLKGHDDKIITRD